MNLPNKLTILRIILVLVLVLVPVLDGVGVITGEFLQIPTAFWIMNVIFIVASITDKLDGSIARKTNQVTTFGKFLDPIADKILVLSALIILVGYNKIPSWIPIIILFRELLVSGYRLVAVEKGKVIAASKWGKIKTVTQMIAIILCFLDKFKFFDFRYRVSPHYDFLVEANGLMPRIAMTNLQFGINILSSVMLIICVIATIFSGYEYLKDGKDMLKD